MYINLINLKRWCLLIYSIFSAVVTVIYIMFNSTFYKLDLVRYSNEVLEKYQGNILFDALCKDDFISYLAKQNVGNAKKIFKITKMEGILTALNYFM